MGPSLQMESEAADMSMKSTFYKVVYADYLICAAAAGSESYLVSWYTFQDPLA